ncbi:MAG: SprT family zinc-dependent metalloprotease [Dehalococcoidia bacterium]
MTECGEVQLGDARIQYRVVRSPKRHKTIEITVDELGLVTIAAPMGTTSDRLEETVRRRAKWIVLHDGAASPSAPTRRFVSGESFPYLGRSVRLTVRPTDDQDVSIRFHHWQFDLDVPRRLHGDERQMKVRAAVAAWYRERAALKLPARVDRIAGLLGVQPKAVLIRDQRIRWASCSADGTLRFNWRAVMAPPALIDYVVAHELAHLRIRAHSAEYWAVVAQAIPDYRMRRERLREVGAVLDIS